MIARDYADLISALRVLEDYDTLDFEENTHGATEVIGEAADAIEELSKPKWIPVTERLPEERKDVLVALRRGEIAVDYYQPNRWGYSDVTHWMPLPTPPSAEGGK